MEGGTATYPLVGRKIITARRKTALRLLWGIGFGVSGQYVCMSLAQALREARSGASLTANTLCHSGFTRRRIWVPASTWR